VLADVNSWASSNPIFSDVRFESGIAVGAKGSFRLNGFPIRATFAIVDPGHELSWVGEAFSGPGQRIIDLLPCGLPLTRT
jgi:hypothetical protein